MKKTISTTRVAIRREKRAGPWKRSEPAMMVSWPLDVLGSPGCGRWRVWINAGLNSGMSNIIVKIKRSFDWVCFSFRVTERRGHYF